MEGEGAAGKQPEAVLHVLGAGVVQPPDGVAILFEFIVAGVLKFSEDV